MPTLISEPRPLTSPEDAVLNNSQTRSGDRTGVPEVTTMPVVDRAILLSLVLFGLVAAWYRTASLGNLPGVNGDEAWYGNLVHDILDGQPRFLTPSNIPVNPFYIVPLLVAHLFAEPSITLLRCTALLSGLLVLPLNFWLACRCFDRTSAIVSTAMLSILPTMIAYSRFGWDMSQMPLATACLLYACVHSMRKPSPGMTRLTWALFLCGLLVHPMSLFLLPLVLLATVEDFGRDFPAILRQWMDWMARPRAAVAGGLVLILLAVVRHDWLHGSAGPVNSASLFAECWSLFADFFSGCTTYRNLAGARGTEAIWMAWRVTLPLLTLASLVHLARSQDVVERRLGMGVSLGIIAFVVVGGPKGLTPGYERYAMFLVVPMVLVWSRALVTSSAIKLRAVRFSLIAIGTLQLTQFNQLYFGHLRTTGGTSRETYRTGAEELKTAAARTISTETPRDRPALVLTSSFHCYQPLKYLLHSRESVRVELVRDRREMHEQVSNTPDAIVWLVDFTTDRDGIPSPLLEMAKEQVDAAVPFVDYGGRKSLKAIKLRR